MVSGPGHAKLRAMRVSSRVRDLALAAAASAFVACGPAARGPAAPRHSNAAAPTRTDGALPLVHPARLFAIPGAASASFSAVDADGTRRFIAHGMRLIERVDGSIERADQMLPAAERVQSLKLPARLGGGYVFYLDSAGTTLVWRAASWVGELHPLANVDFDVSAIVSGFDRLYLIERRGETVVGLDPTSGRAMDLGALPPAPAYGSMAFSDAWLGAVDVPFRGTLVTFDAGASWRPLGLGESYGVSLEHGSLVIATQAGSFALDSAGVLHERRGHPATQSVFHGAGRDPAYLKLVEGDTVEHGDRGRAEGPLGRYPLRTAVLYGWPDSAKTAVVAANGVVARVRLSDGRLLAVSPHALERGGQCQALPVGSSFGFVCGQEHGSTVVYAFTPPLGARPLMSFDEPRYVASSQNGGLVIRGGCGAHQAVSDAYCILEPSGKQREVRVRGDRGVERVAALSDGRAAVLVPPRLGARGLLMLVAAGGKTSTVDLKLPTADKPTLELLRHGLWMDGFVQQGKELSGWVVGSGPFVGVRVGLDGRVTAGKIQDDVGHALLSGPLALELVHAETAAETTDGGFKWRAVELPADFDPSPRPNSAFERSPRGCSPVGCAFGPWLRVGWRAHGGHEDVETVGPPPLTRVSATQGSPWLLHCAATGEVAGRRGPKPPRPPPEQLRYRVWHAYAPVSPDEIKSTAWLDFLGHGPPGTHAGDVRFDNGTEYDTLQMRGYAWGARGANWDRVGHWLLRVADRFSVKRGVWSTAVSRSPWDDMATAAQAFGVESTGPSTNWSATLDPSGQAGVLLINTQGTPELYVFERDRSIVHVAGAAPAGLSNLAGAVKIGSTWYVGSHSADLDLSVFRIDGGTITLVRMFRMQQVREARVAELSRVVRNERGDALGVWTVGSALRGGTTSWYVYPLNLRTGQAEEPLVLSPERLAGARACGDDDPDGWVLEGPPPLAPYLDFAAGAQSVRARRVEARVVANASDLCVDALASQADALMPRSLRPPEQGVAAWARGQSTMSLALTDRSTGRRWGFRCVR
jgi:hypothetical protein